MRSLFLVIALFGFATTASAGEWTKGVPYTTNWDDAIAKCRETGRMLFIYNGWQKKGI